MGYTDVPNDRLLAFGASSISELDEGIAQNIPQATSYVNLITADHLATKRGHIYVGDDLMRKDVISALMCYFCVDLEAILQKHNRPLDYFDAELALLSEFVTAGLITIEGRFIRFQSPLKMLVRTVAAVFDTYANSSQALHRFSKVA